MYVYILHSLTLTLVKYVTRYVELKFLFESQNMLKRLRLIWNPAIWWFHFSFWPRYMNELALVSKDEQTNCFHFFFFQRISTSVTLHLYHTSIRTYVYNLAVIIFLLCCYGSSIRDFPIIIFLSLVPWANVYEITHLLHLIP